MIKHQYDYVSWHEIIIGNFCVEHWFILDSVNFREKELGPSLLKMPIQIPRINLKANDEVKIR